MTRDLTGIEALSDDGLHALLGRAEWYAGQIAAGAVLEPVLKGKLVLTAFFENSTRTRVSFEVAAQRLGASVVNWEVGSSSLSKGESFADTIRTLNAMGPDALVLRHGREGAMAEAVALADCPVINAGEGAQEHPTQALLDALTIRQAKGAIEGVTIAICGDVAHSRVARSNMALLPRLGANVRLIGPPALLPETLPAQGIERFEAMEEGLPGCDIVMMLRIQKERLDAALDMADEAYFHSYGLTQERLALAGPEALVMHPGPMNRNVEIADNVADDPERSLIVKQVANGVPARMAVLERAVAG